MSTAWTFINTKQEECIAEIESKWGTQPAEVIMMLRLAFSSGMKASIDFDKLVEKVLGDRHE